MVIDFSGRFNGEAFVQFTNIDDAYKALDNHKKMMGHRFESFYHIHFHFRFFPLFFCNFDGWWWG